MPVSVAPRSTGDSPIATIARRSHRARTPTIAQEGRRPGRGLDAKSVVVEGVHPRHDRHPPRRTAAADPRGLPGPSTRSSACPARRWDMIDEVRRADRRHAALGRRRHADAELRRAAEVLVRLAISLMSARSTTLDTDKGRPLRIRGHVPRAHDLVDGTNPGSLLFRGSRALAASPGYYRR